MKRNLMKRIAAAVVALALLVGAAGPLVQDNPEPDTAVEVVAANSFSDFSGAVYRYGGSWS